MNTPAIIELQNAIDPTGRARSRLERKPMGAATRHPCASAQTLDTKNRRATRSIRALPARIKPGWKPGPRGANVRGLPRRPSTGAPLHRDRFPAGFCFEAKTAGLAAHAQIVLSRHENAAPLSGQDI
jgi:hypothetical protein